MTTSERSLKLKKLGMTRNNQISLLSNAKCLSEGIDVPTLDAVAFIDPKNSIIDIVQQIGRAIRKSKSKSIGTVIVPIFIEKGKDVEETISKSKFEKLIWVKNALKSHDSI